jgi:hypothetical protein
VSSNKPNGGSREVDGCEEVLSRFVVTCSNSAEEFEFGEEVFDQVACFVEIFVIVPLNFAVSFGWNHRDLACLLPWNQDTLVGIEALVGKQNLGFQLRQ